MTIRKKLIQEILNKIDTIPEKKLKELLEYINKIEDTADLKKGILSFGGSWEELDQDLFDDLTINLQVNRNNDRPIIN